MSWVPAQQGLDELMTVLRDSSSPDSETQRLVQQRLESFKQVPDYPAYLCHILLHLPSESASHRAVAGLLLKNNIAGFLTSPNPTSILAVNYVKANVCQGMADPEVMIRQTVGSCIVTILSTEERGGWREGLEALANGVGSQDENVVEGSFNALSKIAEDCPTKLDFEIAPGQNLLDLLVPHFISFTNHSSPKIRLYALEIVHYLASAGINAIAVHIDGIIAALFQRANDESPDVRREVCSALGYILSSRADKLIPQMPALVDYISFCMKDADDTVALEACEFWLTFAEEPTLKEQLQRYLSKVAPLLLDGMVYSEYDLLWLDNDDQDEAVPDKEQDIKPKTYGGKTHAQTSIEDPSSSTQAAQAHKSRDAAELDDEDEDDFDDDFDDEEDGAGEWNLRKCSAAALDVMALSFGSELLEILLPYLQVKLFDSDWRVRESGILALGAIAEGCIDGLEPHLPQLVPLLVNALKDEKALVRSITCWTLGRYASWVVDLEGEENRQNFFMPTMEGLLSMVLDGNKRVQEAGCSAFATFEEEAGSDLEPYLSVIIQQLVFAFQKYQQKNLLILYDALGTLADSVGTALGKEEYLKVLMPPLIEKWTNLSDVDSDLVPLLECLSSISIAAGDAFAPYTQPVYERCVRIIHSSLMQYQAWEQNQELVEEPDRTFIVVALDLLSGLTQGLGTQIVPLVAQTEPSLIQLMAVCLKHQEAPVRQSAHALLGDLAISCFDLLRPFLPEIMPQVIMQIEAEPQPEAISVCNNAAWAVGEIALQFASDPQSILPYVPALIERLVPILLNPRSPKSLSENAAVTIGRIGLVCPAAVAPELATFAQAWCIALWEIKDNDEKDSAFRGFCMMVSQNPAGLETSFVWFCNAVCKWQTPSHELDAMFRQILTGFRSSLGPRWDEIMGTFPPVIRERLQQRYSV